MATGSWSRASKLSRVRGRNFCRTALPSWLKCCGPASSTKSSFRPRAFAKAICTIGSLTTTRESILCCRRRRKSRRCAHGRRNFPATLLMAAARCSISSVSRKPLMKKDCAKRLATFPTSVGERILTIEGNRASRWWPFPTLSGSAMPVGPSSLRPLRFATWVSSKRAQMPNCLNSQARISARGRG